MPSLKGGFSFLSDNFCLDFEASFFRLIQVLRVFFKIFSAFCLNSFLEFSRIVKPIFMGLSLS